VRWPSRSNAAARFAVSVDLPTPPFPDATAITRVARSSEMPFVRSFTPPRSRAVSAAFSSGLMTSKSVETVSIPGSGRSSRRICSSKLWRNGQPGTVRAIVTAIWLPSTLTSRTMPSSVTGFFSSGSMTLPSASVICCGVGCIATSLDTQEFLESQAVPDREALPVVVVVGVDVDFVVAPAGDPLCPLADLALGVVPALTARPGVEAHERPVRRQLELAERVLRAVRDHERNAVRLQQLVHVARVPGGMAKLEAVPPLRQRRERGGQPLVVPLEGRRQLPENGAHLRRRHERRDPLVEERDPRLQAGEPLDVRDVAAHLHGEEEAGRAPLGPATHGRDIREPVEGVVDLDRVEEPRVVAKPLLGRQALRIDQLAPVGVVPARAADPDFTHMVRISARRSPNSSVAAATTSDFFALSSGEASHGRASAYRIERPTSRTSSCAAAVSTARASRSEQTASTLPAASWQRESASEPMIRNRCAYPASAG